MEQKQSSILSFVLWRSFMNDSQLWTEFFMLLFILYNNLLCFAFLFFACPLLHSFLLFSIEWFTFYFVSCFVIHLRRGMLQLSFTQLTHNRVESYCVCLCVSICFQRWFNLIENNEREKGLQAFFYVKLFSFCLFSMASFCSTVDDETKCATLDGTMKCILCVFEWNCVRMKCFSCMMIVSRGRFQDIWFCYTATRTSEITIKIIQLFSPLLFRQQTIKSSL